MPNVDLLQTTDAAVWAKEFCRLVGRQVPEIRNHEMWMQTWFTNAIMCGEDHATGHVAPPLKEEADAG